MKEALCAICSVEHLRQLRERRWDEVDLLVLYIDGQRFGSHHVISAVGVDRAGTRHVLGIEVGATENAVAVKQLFTHLREQGLPTDRKYLFVIDGAKALRAAIEEVFGAHQPVQRCRNHKMRNVLDQLPRSRSAPGSAQNPELTWRAVPNAGLLMYCAPGLFEHAGVASCRASRGES